MVRAHLAVVEADLVRDTRRASISLPTASSRLTRPRRPENVRAHRSLLARRCLVLLDVVLDGLNERVELIRRGGRGHFCGLDPLAARRGCGTHSGSGVEGHVRRGSVCRSRARGAWPFRRGGGRPDRLDWVVRHARGRDPCCRHGRCRLDGRRGRRVAPSEGRFHRRRPGGHRRLGGHGTGGDARHGCSQPPQDETGTHQDRCDADAKARRALRRRRAP